MGSYTDNIVACITCPFRQQRCHGPCACIDGGDIRDHAQAGECPKLRFASQGLGDTVAKVLDRSGVGPAAKALIERVTGRPCGCPKRRKVLNKLVPYGQAAS